MKIALLLLAVCLVPACAQARQKTEPIRLDPRNPLGIALRVARVDLHQ